MDIIEIAKECGAEIYHEGEPGHDKNYPWVQFMTDELQQFAQRIEAPHKQRIAELEQQVRELEENLDIEREEVQSLESDITGYENDEIKLNEQIEQLREALQNLIDCAIHGYDMSEDHNYIVNARQALEGK